MLNFRSFLIEVPTLIPDYKEEENRLNVNIDHHLRGGRVASATHTGHHVYLYHGDKFMLAVAHNPKTGNDDLSAMGNFQKNKKLFTTDTLEGRKGSTLKMDEFLHHLIVHHGFQIDSSHLHSIGGQKVFHKLARKSDIHTTHISLKGLHLPLDKKNWEKQYRNPHSTFRMKKKKFWEGLNEVVRTPKRALKLINYIRTRQNRPGQIGNRIGGHYTIYHSHVGYPKEANKGSKWGMKPSIKNVKLYHKETKHIPLSTIERGQATVNVGKLKDLVKLYKKGKFSPEKLHIPVISDPSGKNRAFDGHHSMFIAKLLGMKTVPVVSYTRKNLKHDDYEENK